MTSETEFTIHQAGAGDAGGILDCLGLAFAPYRGEYTPEAFSDTVLSAETIHRRMAEMIILVAVSESGQIAGSIAYKLVERNRGHIRGMAVRPEYLGRGVAQALLESAESGLRRLGCTQATLNTTAPLQRAVRFYERNGFRRSGRTRDFFGMPLFEFIKDLDPTGKEPL